MNKYEIIDMIIMPGILGMIMVGLIFYKWILLGAGLTAGLFYYHLR